MTMRDDILGIGLSLLVAFAVTVFAVFAGVGAAGLSQAPQGAVAEPSCSEWTDGCVVCTRTPQGLACSTPGIACVKTQPRCLRP
jgi:hypothetical protein